MRVPTPAKYLVTLGAIAAMGGLPAAAQARHGKDDPAPHHRHGGDDGPGHHRHGGDDGPGHDVGDR